MTHFVRPEEPILTPGSSRCYCTVCGHLFLTHVAFDLHRGIEGSDDEDHQDTGACWTIQEMVAHGLSQWEPWVWGTVAEIQQAEKFAQMREIRNAQK